MSLRKLFLGLLCLRARRTVEYKFAFPTNLPILKEIGKGTGLGRLRILPASEDHSEPPPGDAA